MGSADDILFAPIGAKTDIILPDIWLKVIDSIRVQPAWRNSTLAGGALRDLENGRPVKDVDIFVPFFSNAEAATQLSDVTKALCGARAYEIPHNTHNASQLGREGISHFQFHMDGWKFEISQRVEIFDHQTLLDSFDIGLCMISLDTNNVIYRSPEYKHDVAHKSITVVRETGGREVEHAERLLKKYNGWTIVPL